MAQGTTKGVPIDTDPTLSANSDLLVPSQKAVKTYAQPLINGTGFVKATGTTISFDNSTYTPDSRNLTINGVTYDLSANRTWSVGTVTSVAALTLGTIGADLSSTVANGTTTPVITLNVPTASATNRGALSSSDWSRFNSTPRIILSDIGTYTLTGTTAQTIMKAILIPANTFTGGVMFLDYLTTRVSGANNNIVQRVFVGTSATVIGTQIMALTTLSTTTFWARQTRTIAYKSATSTLTFNSTTLLSSELGTNTAAATSTNINWTIDQYIQIVLTNASASDTSSIQWITLTHLV